jgi:hypothetical protein
LEELKGKEYSFWCWPCHGLVLKISAQVELKRNLNVALGLVRGIVVRVIDFENDLPYVQFDNEIIHIVTLEEGKYMPLDLAWAKTIQHQH